MKNAIFAIPVACLLSACAAAGDPSQPPRVWNDNDYVTGSNLPRRDRSKPTDAQTMSRQQIEELQLPRPAPMPAGGR
jgi:hypothetical protein